MMFSSSNWSPRENRKRIFKKMESVCIKILFMSINIVFASAAIYESVSIARPKCNGVKQKTGLSITECILVCQRKNKIATIQEGRCFCLEASCAYSEETDGNQENQPTTLFRRMNPVEEHNFQGSSSSNPAKSCKEINKNNPSLKTSAFYWIQLDQPSLVYCDMVTNEGGWMMIGNLTLTNTTDFAQLYWTTLLQNPDSRSFSKLNQVNNGRFLLDGSKLSELEGYIDFSQVRIFCTKQWHQRTFHMMTKRNPSGERFNKFVSGEADQWLDNGTVCSSTFERIPDDSSSLAQDCLANDPLIRAKSLDDRINGRLYDHCFYTLGNKHVLVGVAYDGISRFECDDMWSENGFTSIGSWYYFVR